MQRSNIRQKEQLKEKKGKNKNESVKKSVKRNKKNAKPNKKKDKSADNKNKPRKLQRNKVIKRLEMKMIQLIQKQQRKRL